MKDNPTPGVLTKTVLTIAGAAFVLHLLVAFALPALGLPLASGVHAVVGGLVLVLLLIPVVHWAVSRSMAVAPPPSAAAPASAAEPAQPALTDSLTRLMNQRGITMNLLDAMAQAQRYDHPLTVAMADIDHLQRVNDAHGRTAGDKVLTQAAAVLAEALRMPDKVGRYGGEEFLVILPHTALSAGRKIADRIRAAFERWDFDVDGAQVDLTVSLGVTQFRKGEDLEQLLSRANKALSQAKAEGRNRVVAQKPTTDARAAS